MLPMKQILWLPGVLLLSTVAAPVPGCIRRSYPSGIVCVCNATYCDEVEPLESVVPVGQAVVYRTSMDGARLDKSYIRQTPSTESVTAELDPSIKYQEIFGFGGAFTDATGINIDSLKAGGSDMFLKQYFGGTGTEYTLGRVPIASTDFSLYAYSYDDSEGDFNLTQFALSIDDYQYKIPYIKKAIEMQKECGGLRLFAAPWSAPGWMKKSGEMKGGGKLLGPEGGQYYETWAKYFVGFFEAYLAEGIPFWGVSIQNEPMNGFDETWQWQGMCFDAPMERNFARTNLVPARAQYDATRKMKIMGLDDQRWYLPGFADLLFEEDSPIDGIAVHWYEDELFPASALTHTHERHPDKFIINTEACTGWSDKEGRGPSFGNYTRGEQYAHSIIEDLNHWVNGWVDWNLAVDQNGGYNWAMNYVDSPIIVSTPTGEFLKQPMYYMMAHFSKFLKPGSYVVQLTLPALPPQVEAVGAVMADGKRFVAVLNSNDSQDVTISIFEKGDIGVYTNVIVPARSIATIVWSKY